MSEIFLFTSIRSEIPDQLKIDNKILYTLSINGKSFVQAKLVVIVGIPRRANFAMRPPCGSHSAATIRFSDRTQFRSPGGASATDCLQETIADSSV